MWYLFIHLLTHSSIYCLLGAIQDSLGTLKQIQPSGSLQAGNESKIWLQVIIMLDSFVREIQIKPSEKTEE